MTTEELQNRCTAMATKIGPKADVGVIFSNIDGWCVSVHPFGVGKNVYEYFNVASDWDAAFAAAETWWDERIAGCEGLSL